MKEKWKARWQKFKEKLKAACRAAVNGLKRLFVPIKAWAKENPETVKAIAEWTATFVVIGGLKARRKAKKKQAEIDEKELYVYDRRTDTWSELKRPLKKEEKLELELYYHDGGMKSAWLYTHGLLKR